MARPEDRERESALTPDQMTIATSPGTRRRNRSARSATRSPISRAPRPTKPQRRGRPVVQPSARRVATGATRPAESQRADPPRSERRTSAGARSGRWSPRPPVQRATRYEIQPRGMLGAARGVDLARRRRLSRKKVAGIDVAHGVVLLMVAEQIGLSLPARSSARPLLPARPRRRSSSARSSPGTARRTAPGCRRSRRR